MHTIELLAQATSLAESLGYGIRQEWLGGATGGACTIAGRPWLFVDLALNPIEQLQQVVDALKQDPRLHGANVPEELRHLLDLKRVA